MTVYRTDVQVSHFLFPILSEFFGRQEFRWLSKNDKFVTDVIMDALLV